MFTKGKTPEPPAPPQLAPKPALPDAAPKRAPVARSGPSIISADVKMVGKLFSTGELDINGQIEGDVRASALTTAYDYGRAEAHARGAANELTVCNNDIYVEIDNTQFNTGGVDVVATFSGTNGYDVSVGADAVGNSVTGYACSECDGRLEAANTQTNTGDVSAIANTTVAGSNRSVITGANAVGNSASFYVSRPGN